MKTIKINNRRYLGNKYKLLSFIKDVVNNHCHNINVVADIFAGTGSVASAFIDKDLIVNDYLYSNYISNHAWFSSQKYNKEKIKALISKYNALENLDDNYMSLNFGNTYFSAEDCKKIGYIREDLDRLYEKSEINFHEKSILITSLLYAMDKIANTVGHYDAYRKNVPFEKHLELCLPDIEKKLSSNNRIYNQDTNELVKSIYADLVYIDPPYNSRQYCDAYHLLENVACWNEPPVYGVARKMDRSNIKSKYCTNKATEAFENLIENINAKYILLSYNNMAKKGNDRSNAKISDDDIFRILNKKGKLQVFSTDHKAFSTGKSDISDNEERLFLVECKEYIDDNIISDIKKDNYIQSPLNYTGGKYKLLKQILPLFPKKIGKFYDLFSGGANVGINVEADTIILNDNNKLLMDLLATMKKIDTNDFVDKVEKIITLYNLSESSINGYDYYNCNSSSGLGKYNKDKYINLRKDFNECIEKNNDYYIMLYVLIVYAFNNQIRFNSKGEFNLPVGKRDFNKKMKNKLICFLEKIKNEKIQLMNKDFRRIDPNTYPKDSFCYIDPPYLIGCATYNENNGWNEDDEKDLLAYLDKINECGVKFALSNVLMTRGTENILLKNWIKENKYSVHHLDYKYSNSNYQRSRGTSDEVLITNY